MHASGYAAAAEAPVQSPDMTGMVRAASELKRAPCRTKVLAIARAEQPLVSQNDGIRVQLG
jgi:hypothetical protein